MARATANLFNPHILGPLTDGYTVVPSLNVATADRNTGRRLHMDAIRVWAVFGGCNLHIFNADIVAMVKRNMKYLAVDRS